MIVKTLRLRAQPALGTEISRGSIGRKQLLRNDCLPIDQPKLKFVKNSVAVTAAQGETP